MAGIVVERDLVHNCFIRAYSEILTSCGRVRVSYLSVVRDLGRYAERKLRIVDCWTERRYGNAVDKEQNIRPSKAQLQRI